MQHKTGKSATQKLSRAHWLRACPYAHRGLHAHPAVAENSLPALRLAVEHGFGCAIDVRVLHDGTPVLFHDEDAARMTGIAGAIEDRSLTEISQLRLRRSGEKIPTLAQALNTIDGRTPLIIDFKSVTQAPGLTSREPQDRHSREPQDHRSRETLDRHSRETQATNRISHATQAPSHLSHATQMPSHLSHANQPPDCISAVCDQLRDYPGEFAILSSSGRDLAWLARHAPDIVRGQTFVYDAAVPLPGMMAMALQLHAAIRHARLDFITLDLQTLSVARAWLIKARLPLIVWTVVNLAQWRWAALHASNFMFELSAQMPLASITDRATADNATAYQPSSLRQSNTPPPHPAIYTPDNSIT